MSKINIFMDSSALMAGIISSVGAGIALLLLGENQTVDLVVSEQVIAEVERNLARKAPTALPFAREMIVNAKIKIVRDPAPEEVHQRLDWISHPADVPILLTASKAGVDFLATLNTRHFLDDPGVALKSGLRLGTPGDALAWVRACLERTDK